MDLTFLFKEIAKVLQLPKSLTGKGLTRQNPCSFCGSYEGKTIGQMQYWDLSQHSLVACPQCDLVQIDPMLSPENLEIGCKAFYQFEKKGHGLKELKRTCLRNFRKGIAFGIELKRRGLKPASSLEMGAGDAYFSRGLKYVYPNLKVYCLDVVPEVLAEIERKHGFKGIRARAEDLSVDQHGSFDLVIARDFLEHVSDPLKVIQSTFEVLKPGGVFHFITPNGFEDLWKAHVHWKLTNKPSELLINHVNYFAPKGLRTIAENCGFEIIKWIIFDFKGFRKGKGYRFTKKLSAQSAHNRNARQTYAELKDQGLDFSSVLDQEIMNIWWAKWPLFAKVYCYLRHRHKFWVHADLGVGHEIDAILTKPSGRLV